MSSFRRSKQEQKKEDKHLVLGFAALWTFAHWQLFRAALWGVVAYPGRRGCWSCDLVTDPASFWGAIYLWVVLGPFFLIGTAVFMWVQRKEPI